MTQLIIDGHEAVLPKNFACTVKRENSFFTKNGEYTYDITLRLDNQVNCQLYEFLNRLNKTDQIDTKRTATLIADGHVYTRGTEIVTRWTDETVTIQIVSGESELNYFIGQDLKIEDLDLGEVESDSECVFPVVRTSSGGYVNVERKVEKVAVLLTWSYKYTHTHTNDIAMPYLCDIVARILDALGYTVGTDQLKGGFFSRVFLVNTFRTREYAKMLRGWTVKDFLTEVEKLTGVVFVTDNVSKTCDIIKKTEFYTTASQFTIRNVTDAYEAEVQDDDSQEAEFASSNVSFDIPDHQWQKLMRLSKDLPTLETVEYNSLEELIRNAWPVDTIEGHEAEAAKNVILVDASTGRKYIRVVRHQTLVSGGSTLTSDTFFIMEVDQFPDVEREGAGATLELKITPAPMAHFIVDATGGELIDLGSSDGFWDYADFWIEEQDEEEGAEEEVSPYKSTIEETLRSAEKTESSAGDLYVAIYDGEDFNGFPIVYTDAYHASVMQMLYNGGKEYSPTAPEGALSLQWLDSSYFQGSYEIDTSKAVTIETYDPNVIDPRQVYVIRNKRFVCREVEEVITAEGRQAKWKATFYPITITDEALEKRWVLTNGTWDDGAAWLDDGRWNDGPSPSPEPSPSPGPEPDSMFTYALEAFDNVSIVKDSVTYNHLLHMYEEAKSQFYDGVSLNGLPLLYSQGNFPMVYNHYGSTQQRQQAFQKMVAWIFAMTLAELAPSKRNAFYQKAYDFWGAGKQIATYQHRFDSDTNVARLVGSAIWATMRDATKIPAMRTEVGGSTITYTSSSYEILVDTKPFMPAAPGPYLSDHDVNGRQGATPTYGESPGGYPVGDANADHNLVKDQQVYDYVVANYNLSTANAVLKQRTVQAIADKEYELPHLFGGSRTVTDPTYGTLTFNPVFGAHNLGVTISPTGAIANLVSAVAADCSRTRETLLHQQYGRRRPGQGATDGSAKSNSQERALVNYSIEEGDGHTTGYYNQNGDYIKRSDNTHIGDYVDYFQRKLSANSYPSGHSAYIWGVALILMEVMPDLADKIMKAANDFAMSRVIARYHWMSDTIHGRVIGSVMIPVEHALTNVNYASLLASAKAEYQALIAA